MGVIVLFMLSYSTCNFIICLEWVSSENAVNVELIQTEVRLSVIVMFICNCNVRLISPHVMPLTSGPTHLYLFKNHILQTPSIYSKITWLCLACHVKLIKYFTGLLADNCFSGLRLCSTDLMHKPRYRLCMYWLQMR